MTPQQLANVYLKAASKVDPFADDAVLAGLAAVGEKIAEYLLDEAYGYSPEDVAAGVRGLTGAVK